MNYNLSKHTDLLSAFFKRKSIIRVGAQALMSYRKIEDKY